MPVNHLFDLLVTLILVGCALGLVALLIWSSLLYSAVSLGRNLTKPWNVNNERK